MLPEDILQRDRDTGKRRREGSDCCWDRTSIPIKGEDAEGRRWDFSDLIYRINAIDGLQRIRFMTSHPKDLSDKLIQAYVDCDKLCNYIHLPVQSGSSRVLKRMNRRYDRQRYLDLVQRLRRAVPEITISTDIIVGFPGETEEDFEDTLDLVNQVQYDSAFTFLYSVRKGTPAEKFEDQIPEDAETRTLRTAGGSRQ